MSKRKIAIFTGNRAEYGLQYPIIKAVDQHPDLEYLLLVSGAHLDGNFGRTLSEIQEDGFRVDAEVKIDMDSDSRIATAQVIMTYPNNDAGGRLIIAGLGVLESEKVAGIQVHRSLGRHLYHGVLGLARNPALRVACVGNSSSGIKETPVFGCPTVNIGSRQLGRLRASNVIDSHYDAGEIVATVRKCLNDEDFRNAARNSPNPYYLGGAGIKVAEALAAVRLDQTLLRKSMTLQGEVRDGWYR
jgi:UDP-N-acetylglucosamine 2-epimerase